MVQSLRARAIAGVVALGVAAAGAGWWWQSRGAGRDDGAATQTARNPNEAFAFVDCKSRLFDDRPALAVAFTQPLEQKQPLGDLLRVTDLGAADGSRDASTERPRAGSAAPPTKPGDPASQGRIVQGEWTLGDNPRVAYFPYVQVGRRFRVDVKSEVRSADGATLPAVVTCEVASEAMPPSFFFASRGVVLPARQNGGLPVVTVNVPEIDVQFLRIEPSHLPKFLERLAAGRKPSATRTGEEGEDEGEEGDRHAARRSLQGMVSTWELDNLKGSARSVHLGRYTTDDQPNRRKVSFLPVEAIEELQRPGVYVAVMAQPGRFREEYQVTYFYVSDIGLHARRYATSLDAFATSLRSGEAMTDVEFELLDAHARSLGKVRTDAEGHGSFAVVPETASLLVARRGAREMSVVVLKEPGLDLSEFDVGGHPSRNTKLFAYAGRDLYRPGERFDVSVLARDADGMPLAPLPLTATLKRPDGRTVLTATWRPDDRRPGFFQHAVSLPADAQTGAWLLELRADPGARQADALWRFQVEEFLPERMKLGLSATKPVLLKGDAFNVAVQGDYLFGSPAAGNRLLAAVAGERARFALPQPWPGFIFGDFADDDRRSRRELGDQSLDDRGAAAVSIPLDTEPVNSPMRLRASFSLLETGGRPVVRSIERLVWPAPELIAVRPLFDRDVAREGSNAEFEVVRVDTEGRFAPLADKPASVRLVREERQYYWRFDDQKGWHSGYTETDETVQSLTLALKERSKLSVPVQWGRYRIEIEDPETGLKLRHRFYAGWGAQDAEDIGNRPDRVQIKLARAPLEAGDNASLTIVPPHDGQALVTVEGDRLLWSRRIDVFAKGTTLDIPLAEILAKGGARHDLYVGVTAFRAGSQGDRVTPSRAVGLVHLPIARDERKLAVSITAPAKVLPEKRATVKVRAEGLAGRQAHVTLSAVDVGILDITRYAAPDPFDFFFGKQRYAPEIADMYGKLIEKMEGSTATLKFGGDSGMRNTRSLPKKVKLVDLFSGPVALDAKGAADIALDIPDFNGTLRLMAVVAAPDRFGSAQAQIVAAAPVVAELATARFISPGDASAVTLDLTNLSGAARSLRVKLEGAEPVRIGDGERELKLADGQRTSLRFPVEATDAYGLGRLRLQVSSTEGDHAIDMVRESFLQVQPPVPLERDVRRVKLEPGTSHTIDPASLGRHHEGSATLSVSVSNKPPLNVKALVQGLFDYPYGCLEQTASAAYPNLFIDEAAAKSYGLEPRTREQRARIVEGAMGRMAGLQKANGGFTLWGDGPYETWLSAYVVGFMQDAREQGFSVPEPLFRKAQEWLLDEIRQAPNRFPALPASARPDAGGAHDAREHALLRDSHQRFAEMAHAAYILARDQRAPLATLRALHDQFRDRARSPLPLVHLALALRLMGDESRAAAALDDAMKRPYGITTRGDRWMDASEWLGDYGSPARDLAMTYALLARHGVAHTQRENLLFDLAARLGGRRYFSTQERLALFLAARAAGGESQGEWAAQLRVGGSAQAIASRSSEQRSFDADDVAKGITLVNRHAQPLFVEIDIGGYPREPLAPRADAIEVRRDWFESDGRAWNGRPLAVGDMLVVRVQARARQRIEDALIIDRIPAGFEVENLNLSQGPKAGEFKIGGANVALAMADPRIKHREYRDDRYVAAARLEAGWLSVYYLARVVSPGRFIVPAPYAEDMYRPELRGVGHGGSFVTIIDPRAAVDTAVAAPR